MDGDVIVIDSESNKMDVLIDKEELIKREKEFKLPKEIKDRHDSLKGVLFKYRQLVGPPHKGCLTDSG